MLQSSGPITMADIAAELGISARTVEVHKARMMDKLGVNNVADLVRLNLELPS